MEELESVIKETGWKGKITAYGFTINEITEIIEKELYETGYIHDIEYGAEVCYHSNFHFRSADKEKKECDELNKKESWRYGRLSKEEREKLFYLTKEEMFEMRRQFLEQAYERSTRKYFEALQNKQDTKKLLKERFHRKIEYEIFTYRPQDDRSILEHEIAVARNKPITNFIEHKKFFALCPFHNEKTPSMYLKNNFAYCFSCNWKGDTIALVMKIKGFTFPQAVKYLQS